MKNSKNKVVAALVCGVIMGSIGTSFIGNFQSQEQSISNAQNQQNSSTSNNSYTSNDSNEDSYGEMDSQGGRGGKHGGHHQYDDSQDTTPTIDTTTENYKDGTYTGTASGYAPNLTVDVTVSGGKITNIEIVSHNESPGFYERAFETVPEEIISSQSTDVDTVSGATFSSKGIINAVEDALQDASSDSSTSSSSSSSL